MKPLEGIRVIEAAQMISAPMAGAVMAEQGADVIKVELADGIGDRLRRVGSRRNNVSAVFNGVNHAKRSITLNTKKPEGLKVLLELCAGADVFLQNFRPGAAERMGAGEAAIRKLNPDVVYVSVSGFGDSGPKADQKVYDYVIQAMTGMADLQEADTGSPQLMRQFVVDKVTALTVSQAITAALFARERGHGGQHVHLSMLDVGLWFFWPDGMMDRSLQGEGVQDAPHFADMYDIKVTTDGHVAIIASGSRRSWPDLCNAFNPDWLDEPTYATPEDREANWVQLGADLNRIIATMTTAEVLEAMAANDVAGAAIAERSKVLADPQVVHNQSVIELTDGAVGRRIEALPPVRFGNDVGLSVPAAAPGLGEHTDQILGEIGYDAASIDSLRAAGVLG
jgi:crotonobetainyl-CoA:carnitine CoA-transferase CaiB-like acyl-CoA transferase